MKWSLSNVRVRDKMLILYILSVFLPIVLTNIIFYNVTTNNVKNQRMKDITLAVEQVNNEFRAEIEDVITVSSVFYTDYTLNEILETEYAEMSQYIEDYNTYIRKILNSYTPVYTSIKNITVYTNNPTLLQSWGIDYLSQEVRSTEWYGVLAHSHSSFPIVMRTNGGTTNFSFSVIRRMNYFSGNDKWEKILKIDLKESAVHQIFSNMNVQGYLYLINEDGIIEYATDPNVNWQTGESLYSELELPKHTIEFGIDANNTLNGWRIIGTISENEVYGEVKKSRDFVFVLACINMILPTLIIVWITRSLNHRLIRIVRHMKRVKNQNFETLSIQGEARDEIGQLTSEFNRMIMKIKSLIDDVYIADIQKKSLELQSRNAQLNALQSQINPHFLFNVLETIRMRSLMKNEDETAKIIQNMAKIFRNSLSWKKDMVVLKDEMELIRCFLEIQQYRFGDKFTYEIDVAESVLQDRIPKLTLLTFVENASIHGIEPLKLGGIIRVRATKNNGRLNFLVSDNGIGMDRQTKERLLGYRLSDEEMGDRIGVQNVIYRLKLYYADRFVFHIESEPDQGTSIRIEIPLDDDR